MVFRENGRLVASVPARLSAAQLEPVVQGLVEKFLRRERERARPPASDELVPRARALFDRHVAPVVDEALPLFTVRWVDNQNRRWGSCTPADGAIRLSRRLQSLPAWVVDYVLLHETLHLIECGHTPRFKRLLARYPLAERARGYLEGYQAAGGSSGRLPSSSSS